jgi:uncharacterized protein
VLPEHDDTAAENVITTVGALGLVTPQRLAAAPSRPELARLRRPWAAVLLGGPNRAYGFGAQDRAQVVGQLLETQRAGWSLAITPSRRTPPQLLHQLGRELNQERIWIWSEGADNPYLSLLAGADAILVTPDSVNMASEAAATGKPIHLVRLAGKARAAKFERFHRALIGRGCARLFDGRMERWTYPPLAETQRVAEEVRRRLAMRAGEGLNPCSVDLPLHTSSGR